IVIAAQLLGKTLRVLSAIDPRIRIMVDVDGVLREVLGVVPLGISQIGTGVAAPGALGAFRVEITLPGAIAESLGGELRIAIESERVAGALTAQTPAGFPRAHLRLAASDGTSDPRPANEFKLRRLVPEALAAEMRHQRGYNRFVSPWIVAIADPRASQGYEWGEATPAQKAQAGCVNCERPAHLQGKGEEDGVFELWSAGRALVVRPEIPPSGAYEFLADAGRFVTRIPTVIAETIRTPEVLVDANHPPVAEGMLQETVYLHSGEVETGSIDLQAGGRAGMDVVIDRTYRSRTIGATPLGEGWSSSLFRRLRVLPGGDVEYRDSSGELWLFKVNGDGKYERPRGLSLRLARTASGWSLGDRKQRLVLFDGMGRIKAET
ncbi:MAG: DUF6531 domain-containing protein, partial [Acidobacteria bacterium]|nr:DUF6531 domain-containing protein [Acidobacteriota bacterium]